MKRHLMLLLGALALCASLARGQTLIESWENTPDGWTILESAWTSTGFNTTNGVTAGAYSWELTATGADYGNVLQSPSSTGLTSLLSDAAEVTLDVLVPTAGSFGYYQQWDLVVNQPGGLGSVSTDNSTYSQSPAIGGPESHLVFTIPSSITSGLAANPTLPTSLTFKIGGGGGGTIYIDNLRVFEIPTYTESWENTPDGWTILEPAWTSSGFNTSNGVTAGTYSWELTATGADYGNVLQSPASTALTTAMSTPGSIDLDVLAPTAGSFGYYQQWDLVVNQPGGLGSVSFDNSTYSQSPSIGGPESHLVFAIPSSITEGLAANPTLPTSLIFKIGGGGGGTIYIDNLLYTPNSPPVAPPAQLWVRELFDDINGDEIPTLTTVGDDSSSVGFVSADPWVPNPSESGIGGTQDNTQLMAFRGNEFNSETAINMGLPGSLDGTYGAMVQQNDNISFTPTPAQGTFWTAGDYMTRQLTPNNFINFQATGEYWFAMTVGMSQDAQYVTFPSSGAGGIGFADGDNSNADFVAVGVTGLNLYLGPPDGSDPFGTIPASKSVYISQGTLGQAGDPYSLLYNPLNDPNANPPESSGSYTQTNFTGGPYYVRAFGTNSQGQAVDVGDGVVVLGHLKTQGGSATLDAKFYDYTAQGFPNNNSMDLTTNNIVWDCSYAFNFAGTMTKMLMFENGQFPFYIFGFRASTNFNEVVGLDPGRIAVAPLSNTFVGYPINMTNLAVEAYPASSIAFPAGYGTLNYQWYQNGVAIPGATSQNLNIASAASTNAGTYTSVATDPTGTWGSVTDSIVISVVNLIAPQVTDVQMFEDQSTIQVTFSEPNLGNAGLTNLYAFNNGIIVTNAIVVNGASSTVVQLETTTVPLGTKITLTISGVTNVVGESVAAGTTETFWTYLMQTGVVNWDAWNAPAGENDQAYFNTFLPSTPDPVILTNMALTSWEGPSSGVELNGGDGVGTDFGDRMYGWFIPPVTTNYVFFISCDDGGRLSLSTNASPTNLCAIAVDSDWNGDDDWTNISDEYPSSPHRGDGTASGLDSQANYVSDNSVAAASPATACDQNRSDQFIVAYYDSSGLPGGPAGATADEVAQWQSADSQVTYVVPPGVTNFWPNRDTNGQALISLVAGHPYFMQLEHIQNTGGYDESVTYKFAGAPDPLSPSATILTGSTVAGLVAFSPSISIAETASGPLITYTGVLLSGTSPSNITNHVALSSGGPSQYTPPHNSAALFYRTSE